MDGKDILKIRNLYKSYEKRNKFKKNTVSVLKDVNLEIKTGEVFGLIGESGCGKSTICNLILGLEKVDSGNIYFFKRDITNIKDKEMRQIRNNIQAVFQDSKSSLNPRMKVYDIVNEPLKNYKIENYEKVKSLIELVGLEENSLNKYPNEFSGGQRQRIAIARALALEPKLIILDESTSNLDTITLNRILGLLRELKGKLNISYLLVSHDIKVIKKICDRVAIIENGTIIETLMIKELHKAKCLYSKKLLEIES